MDPQLISNGDHLRWLSGLVIGGVGLATGLHHVDHLIEDVASVPVVSSIMFPLMLSVALLGAGYWLGQSDYSGEQAARVAIWSLVGAFVLTLSGTVIAAYQHAVAAPGSRTAFVILSSSIVEGTAMGFLVGMYRTWNDHQTTEKD